MKTATWRDGTQTIRETHTRDYKFAFRATTINGETEIGFSTTRKNAEASARKTVNWNLTTERNIAKMRLGLNNFNYSEEGIELIRLTKEALQNIEIVEVA